MDYLFVTHSKIFAVDSQMLGIYLNLSSELLLFSRGQNRCLKKDEEGVDSLWLYWSLSMPYGKTLANLEPQVQMVKDT